MTDRDEGRRALLLVDFQYDFLADDGRMPVARNQVAPVLDAARAELERASRDGDLVITVANEFRPSAVVMNILRRHAAIAGSPGTAWDPDLLVPDAPHVAKWKGDAFVNPVLEELLTSHRIRTVRLTGLKANACITATAKSALDAGYRVELVAAAIACSSDRSRARALRRLERRGAEIVREAEESTRAVAGPS